MMHNNPAAASVEMTEFFGQVEPSGQREVLIASPTPPAGYEPISAVQELSGDLAGYWACLAYQQQGTYGLLIYWQRDNGYSFYPTEDALQLLHRYGAAWGFDLLGYDAPAFQNEPVQDQLDINGPWWRKHGVFVRDQQSNEEVPHAME